jgi:hypothetical protein
MYLENTNTPVDSEDTGTDDKRGLEVEHPPVRTDPVGHAPEQLHRLPVQ